MQIRKIIYFFGLRDYPFFLSKANYKLKYEKGLKILTPKQVLQRFTIALEQVVAGNNSKKLLNEIRQILYLLYQSRKLLKTYTIT